MSNDTIEDSLSNWTHSTSSATSWRQAARDKRAAAAARIPQEWRLSSMFSDAREDLFQIPRKCGILTSHEVEITEKYDAQDLVLLLASGKLSAVQVTLAFSKRAAIAQQLVNCLTETFFEQALAHAKKLDVHFQQTGAPVGPLHGLPISVKDSFNIAGIPTTLGLVSFLNHPLPVNHSALTQILHDAGAVLFVKTNVPQTLMTAESHNNVFGRTLNPHNPALGAGGSSGGEGALLAMRGAPLGIGTDIAGSIRIPALCCGTVGFKPTAGRLPYGGQSSCHRSGYPGITPCAGPLAISIRDVRMLLEVVTKANCIDLDETAIPATWRAASQAVHGRKLKVGVIMGDQRCPLQPPMRASLLSAISKLEFQGHRTIDITTDVPATSDIADVALRYFHLDPQNAVFKHLDNSGEPSVPSVAHLYAPECVGDRPDLDELFNLNAKKERFKAQMRKVWVDHELDVILCAAYQGGTAQPHDSYGTGIYTVVWNLLDYPACVLPHGVSHTVNDSQQLTFDKYHPQYRPEAIEGAPRHIQLVTRSFMDEELVAHALEIESVLNNKTVTVSDERY